MPKITTDQIEVGAGPQHALPKYGPGPGLELMASRLTDTGTAIDLPGQTVSLGDLQALVNNGTGITIADLLKTLTIAANAKSATSNASLMLGGEDEREVALIAQHAGRGTQLLLRPDASAIQLGFVPNNVGVLTLLGGTINLTAPTALNITSPLLTQNGVPLGVAGSLSLLAQTASIGATALTSGGEGVVAGLYRLSYYLVTTVAGTSGSVKATFTWTDEGDTRIVDSDTITFGTLAAPASGTLVIRSSGVLPVTYATTVTAAVGDPQYVLYITLERLQ